MQFGSRQKRNLISGAILGLVPDVIIAIIAAAWTDSGLMGFLVTLIGLQIVYLLIWVKNTIWGCLFFWLAGRKRMAEHLLDYLRANFFPEPDEYQDDVQTYFQGVMDNEHAPTDLRMKAAVEIGTFNTFRLLGKVSLLLQTFLAYEDALQRYKRMFPAKAYA